MARREHRLDTLEQRIGALPVPRARCVVCARNAGGEGDYLVHHPCVAAWDAPHVVAVLPRLAETPADAA